MQLKYVLCTRPLNGAKTITHLNGKCVFHCLTPIIICLLSNFSMAVSGVKVCPSAFILIRKQRISSTFPYFAYTQIYISLITKNAKGHTFRYLMIL